MPFSIAMQAAFTTHKSLRDPSRRRPLLLASALTAAWLALLRSAVALFEHPPLWPWLAMLLTLAVCWSAKRLLDSSPKLSPEPCFRPAGTAALVDSSAAPEP